MDSGVYPPFHVVCMRFEHGVDSALPSLDGTVESIHLDSVNEQDWHRFQPVLGYAQASRFCVHVGHAHGTSRRSCIHGP